MTGIHRRAKSPRLIDIFSFKCSRLISELSRLFFTNRSCDLFYNFAEFSREPAERLERTAWTRVRTEPCVVWAAAGLASPARSWLEPTIEFAWVAPSHTESMAPSGSRMAGLTLPAQNYVADSELAAHIVLVRCIFELIGARFEWGHRKMHSLPIYYSFSWRPTAFVYLPRLVLA